MVVVPRPPPKMFSHTENIFVELEEIMKKKKKNGRDGEKQLILINGVKELPVHVSGMINFFRHYPVYFKNGLFKFPSI